MNKEQIEKKIEEFNEAHDPLYIVDHEDGSYSLCHVINAVSFSEDFGQAAFDAYAEAQGDEICDRIGTKIYGGGYDWEDVFRKFFENDPHIDEIRFDCESDGFFCNCEDLDILLDMGHRLFEIASDTEKFTPVVSEGIKAGKERRSSEEKLMKTVRGRFMQNPTATFYIRTPKGDAVITPQILQGLLSGKEKYVYMKDAVLGAEELLNQKVCGVQQDLLDENVIRMKTEIPQEENPSEELVQKL